MSFRVTGLSPEPFRPLWGLSDEALAAQGARRLRAGAEGGLPDRVELRDLGLGETALLVNFTHQPADTPYRASHAIFVREGAERTFEAVDAIPAMLGSRLLSLRAFDAEHMMVDAEVVEGRDARPLVERLLDDPGVAYLHAHFARRGCYAARFDRA